jgi:ubiquinone/menaquinone biosynthesis C-methylase UbiE
MNATSKSTLQVYERWAQAYPPEAHNPLMRAEQQSMLQMLPDVGGRRVLDLACGSGRYSRLLLGANAAQVVALDFCVPMLRQVAAANRICASMMHLPFQPAVFDVVVCALALGHATDIRSWMTEIARVLRPGGSLLYSDFHPEAVRAGMTRSFKDEDDATWTVPHQTYELGSQRDAAVAAGLEIQAVAEVRVGLELTEAFRGSERIYRDWHGLPVVLVVRACK